LSKGDDAMGRFVNGVWGVLVVAVLLATGLQAGDQGIGVVDMERLIKLHPRTKADTEILEKYIGDFQAERDEMAKELEEIKDQLEALGEEAADAALSKKAREAKTSLARAKFEEFQERKSKLRELTARRQKELTSQELLMRKRVVADIRDVIQGVAAAKKLGLVLDSKGVGAGAYSMVLFHDDAYDITDDVITGMPAGDTE